MSDEDQQFLFTRPTANYSSTNFPTPRDFQVTAHEKLRDGFRGGHKKQLLVAPTGSGKTFCALRIAHESLVKGKRAVFVCDRTALIDQTSKRADEYGLTAHGIVQAKHWRRDKSQPFQIASIQTIQARGFWPDADVTIIDECFTGETIIATPDGARYIATIKAGDKICSAIGEDVVESVFCQSADTLVKVRLSDGSSFACTGDHPIFTAYGWKPARRLAVGTRLFGIQDMPSLWGKTYSIFAEERISGNRNGLCTSGELLAILCEEIKEPDALAGGAQESVSITSRHRPRAENSWRERPTHAGYPGEVPEGARSGMESGIRGDSGHGARERISDSLQNRLGARWSAGIDRVGVGRRESLRSGEAGTGCQEGCVSADLRVESIEVEKLRRGVPVYNLRVKGHPSYFANGVLVHNCHTQYQAVRDYLTTRDVAVIGLTATPCSRGLGLLYTNMVNAATMNELTQSGVLVPMRILTCTKPDMSGAETTSTGEWTEKAASQREAQIIGDVVAEWIKHGENRKTIAFGADIAYCTQLAQRFNEAGVNADTFTSETKPGQREALLSEFTKEDSSIRVLISVEALAKGFDVQDIGCVIDARPLRKSLSTAIQMWGRGLRSSPDTGKVDCLLLDHSGNIQRFYNDFVDVYFNGFHSLDMAEKLDATVRKDEEEFESGGCPACGHKPFLRRCMACGFEKPTTVMEDSKSGEMREIRIGKSVIAADQHDLWRQLCAYVRGVGNPDTQKGRAYHLFKDIIGAPPPRNWNFDSTENAPIHRGTVNKIKSLRIAYIKGRQKADLRE